MNTNDKIEQSYLKLISGMPKDNKINRLLEAVVSSDLHITSIEKENEKLMERNEELERLLNLEKNKNTSLLKQQPKNIINTNEIEVYSTDTLTTVFDHEEDEGMPYFRIPDKETANELLIDSGLALCEYKIKVHIEVIG